MADVLCFWALDHTRIEQHVIDRIFCCVSSAIRELLSSRISDVGDYGPILELITGYSKRDGFSRILRMNNRLTGTFDFGQDPVFAGENYGYAAGVID